MPLSIDKLDKLLETKGFVSNKYYTIEDLCMYVELVSISDADVFLLYIPSKYKFSVKNKSNVYKLKYFNYEDEEENTADDYAGEMDEYLLENTYREIDIGINAGHKDPNIASYLEKNYKRPIILKDISEEDNKEVRDTVRQLKRLRLCVQNVNYKVTIMYKHYICSIKRDDSIECYSIKKYNGSKYKKLFVTTDLETLYSNIDSLKLNLTTVRKGLYHILDKNQFNHTKTLQRLLDTKNDIIEFSDRAYSKKLEYDKYYQEAVDMLKNIKNSEKQKLSVLFELNQKFKDPSLNKGLHNDIDRTHQLSKLQQEISDIKKIKEEIVKTLFDLKSKKEDTMLMVDKIMFDNNVMIECVIRNFSELEKIC